MTDAINAMIALGDDLAELTALVDKQRTLLVRLATRLGAVEDTPEGKFARPDQIEAKLDDLDKELASLRIRVSLIP